MIHQRAQPGDGWNRGRNVAQHNLGLVKGDLYLQAVLPKIARKHTVSPVVATLAHKVLAVEKQDRQHDVTCRGCEGSLVPEIRGGEILDLLILHLLEVIDQVLEKVAGVNLLPGTQEADGFDRVQSHWTQHEVIRVDRC